MAEESKEFQVSAKELAYLKQFVGRDESLTALLRLQEGVEGSRVTIRLRRAEAEQLRDCLTVRLAAVGFERDYSLTEQGQMLEELIDRFYIP